MAARVLASPRETSFSHARSFASRSMDKENTHHDHSRHWNFKLEEPRLQQINLTGSVGIRQR